jgi:hypothetical protein
LRCRARCALGVRGAYAPGVARSSCGNFIGSNREKNRSISCSNAKSPTRPTFSRLLSSLTRPINEIKYNLLTQKEAPHRFTSLSQSLTEENYGHKIALLFTAGWRALSSDPSHIAVLELPASARPEHDPPTSKAKRLPPAGRQNPARRHHHLRCADQERSASDGACFCLFTILRRDAETG